MTGGGGARQPPPRDRHTERRICMARKKRKAKKRDGGVGPGADRQGPKRRKGRKDSSPDTVNYLYMAALSEPLRVHLLEIFCERIASPKEISKDLGEPLSRISYHVVVLKQCGLIVLDSEVPRRGAVEHFYRAAAPTLVPPGAWDNLPPKVREGISLEIMQEFFEDASASMEAELFERPPGDLGWVPLILDSIGARELRQLLINFFNDLLQLQRKVNERLEKKGGKAGKLISITAFMASFLSTRDPKDDLKAFAAKRR